MINFSGIICRLVTQGFHSGSNRTSTDSDSISYMSTVPRLVVSSPLLLELLQVVYHGLERGASGVAQTLHDITVRATYETYAGRLTIKLFCYNNHYDN